MKSKKAKNVLKRIFSMALSLVFFAGINIPTLVRADYKKANVDMVYLGTGDAPATSPITELPNISEMTVGTKFWVGINLTNLSNIDQNTKPSDYGSFFYKTGTEAAASAGIFGLATAFNYLSEYIQPVPTQDYGAGSDADNIAADYDEVFYPTFPNWNTSYSTEVTIGDVLTHESASPSELDSSENQQNIFINIQSTKPTNRVFNTSLEDGKLMASIVQFEIIEKPPVGKKVIEMSLNAHDFVLQTGADGNRWGANWNDDVQTTADINLNNYFVYGGALNLNPATYTVDFYNDSALTTPVGTQLSIKENETVAADKVPAQTDFTAPAGKFYDKLLYFVDDNGTGTADPDTDTEFKAGETKITGNTKVYAHYADGYTVTFDSNYPAAMGADTPTATTKPITVAPKANQVINESSKPKVGAAGTDPAPDFIAPDGWSLVGWYTNQACTDGNEFNFETAAGGDGTPIDGTSGTPMTVYAKWAQEVTYTFDLNYTGADASTTVKKTAGEALGTDAPTDPTRDKYDFQGWNEKSNGSGTMYNAANPLADLAATADKTLYAIWTPKSDQATYTLTFDAAGGNLKNPTSITVVQGDAITQAMMPDNPTKTSATGNDYTFVGWFKEATPSNTNELTRPITLTEDTTAYAHWSYTAADKITITFDDQGATTSVSPSTIDIGQGDAIGALPADPAKTGSSFSGWYPNADGTGDMVEATTTFNATATVYAKWAADVNYTFDYNYDGAPAAATISQKAGTALGDKAPANPTRTDYDFKGWDTASNGTGTRYADQDALKALNEASDKTLYAIWDAASTLTDEQKATITFHSSVDGLNVTPASITVKKGDKLIAAQLPTPKRTDYNLEGWYDKADVTGTKVTDTNGAITVADDMDAYAHWTYTGTNPVTVTFNAPDADGDTKTWTVTIGSGDKVGAAAPVVTRNGFTFKEWQDATDNSKYDPAADAVTANKTVNAAWTEKLTITFDVNTGTADPTAKMTQTDVPSKNLELPNPAPTKANYKLIGWNTAKNGSGTYVDNTMTLEGVQTAANVTTSAITVYAQWGVVTNPDDGKGGPNTPDSNGVCVTFNENVPADTNSPITKNVAPQYKYPKYGEAIGDGQMPTSPERTHYKFVKWNTKPDGSGKDVSATTSIGANLDPDIKLIENETNKYEVTLYAQWDIADDVPETDQAKIILNKNAENKGVDTDEKTIIIYAGDSLGYLPAGPSSTTSEFTAWQKGTVENGFVQFAAPGGDNVLSETLKLPAGEHRYYAKWETNVILVLHGYTESTETSPDKFAYTGEEIKPMFDLFYAKEKETGDGYNIIGDAINGTTPIDPSAPNSGFVVKYSISGTEKTFRDAGTYFVNADFATGSTYANQGIHLAASQPTNLVIEKASLKVKVTPDTQTQKKTTPVPKATISYEGLLGEDATGATALDTSEWAEYFLWTDAGDKDGKIQDSELSTKVADPSEIGKYVIKINPSSNYVIGTVESTDDKQVIFYERETSADGKTPGYPDAFEPDTVNGGFKQKSAGNNIFYEIVPNDPSIKAITVNPVKGGTDGTALDLKGSDYTTTATFDNKETPDNTEYYVRVPDTEADQVKFTVELTNPETTTVTASDGTTLTPVKNPDGTYTITAPLTKKGTDPNVIKITTKAGDAADAPTIEYTFNVQQLISAAGGMSVSVVKPVAPSPEETPVPTTVPVTLKDDTYKADRAFDANETPAYTNYYTVISKDTTDANIDVTVKDSISKVTMTIDGTDAPTVTVTQGTAPNDKVYTGTFQPRAEGETVVKVTVSSPADAATPDATKTYTVTFKRSLAKIELNYGNSPYGEIMKDSTITDKAAAKTAFDTSLTYAKAPTTKLFYTEAWNSYSTFDNGNAYNGDKDDTAIFVYQRKEFKDPGFKLYDATGAVITDEDVIKTVNLSLTMNSFAGGVLKYTSADKPTPQTATATGNNYVFKEFKNFNIIPDVYTLTYTYKDSISNETITVKRQVIAISRLGDVKIDANNIINNLDASEVKKNATAILKANSIYAFRLADAKSDANKIINNLDSSEIKKVAMSLPLFYNALPTE